MHTITFLSLSLPISLLFFLNFLSHSRPLAATLGPLLWLGGRQIGPELAARAHNLGPQLRKSCARLAEWLTKWAESIGKSGRRNKVTKANMRDGQQSGNPHRRCTAQCCACASVQHSTEQSHSIAAVQPHCATRTQRRALQTRACARAKRCRQGELALASMRWPHYHIISRPRSTSDP